MATIKLISPDTKAAFWRAAFKSTLGLPGEPINNPINLTVPTKNYYKIVVDQLDHQGEKINEFRFEEELTVYGDYQVDAQLGEFSKID